jgi:hypothetical protein
MTTCTLTGALSFFVLYISYMTASIPDGISFADLQALAKDAPDDSAIVPTKGPYNGLDEEQLKDLTETWLENMHEACPHPMFAKALAWRILNNLLDWHTAAGLKQVEDGECENGMYWLRDAGKFQAMLNVFQTVSMGPDDFITNE